LLFKSKEGGQLAIDFAREGAVGTSIVTRQTEPSNEDFSYGS
jgi:hypothetical protein